MPLFFVAVRVETKHSGLALEYAWLVLALSPAMLWEIATGTGYLTNSISIVLAIWVLLRTQHRNLAAIAWGITLASRANFFFTVPVVFGWLRQRAGWRQAAQWTALACTTSAALTVPFYLHDPSNFGPFEAADRVFRFDAMFPHAGTGLLIFMSATSIALSLTRMDRVALFRNCALILAIPVGTGIVLASLAQGEIDLGYTRYGTFFAWFALMATVSGISGKRDQPLCQQFVDKSEQISF